MELKILVRIRVFIRINFGADWTLVLWNDSPFTMLSSYFIFEIPRDPPLGQSVLNTFLLLFVTESVSFKMTPGKENV